MKTVQGDVYVFDAARQEGGVCWGRGQGDGGWAGLDCFEKDPNEEERERLLRLEELVLNAIREVNNLD